MKLVRGERAMLLSTVRGLFWSQLRREIGAPVWSAHAAGALGRLRGKPPPAVCWQLRCLLACCQMRVSFLVSGARVDVCMYDVLCALVDGYLLQVPRRERHVA